MLLDARPYKQKKIEELKERVEKLNKTPELVIIRVGNDLASEKYIKNKIKTCEEVGIKSRILRFDDNATNLDVSTAIENLNNDKDVTGILLQLPIPKHLDEKYLTDLIDSNKDVDGFTSKNMGKLVVGEDGPIACTPKGIIELLKYYSISMRGKDVIIINRSNIVGKPLAHLFLKENATVTIAHSETLNLYRKISQADIIVTAIGRPNSFYYGDFKENQTIIDVSINFDENGKMCGDVCKDDYTDLLIKKNCNITPVPNGVGITTVLSLIENTIEICENNN